MKPQRWCRSLCGVEMCAPKWAYMSLQLWSELNQGVQKFLKNIVEISKLFQGN